MSLLDDTLIDILASISGSIPTSSTDLVPKLVLMIMLRSIQSDNITALVADARLQVNSFTKVHGHRHEFSDDEDNNTELIVMTR